MAAVFSTRFDFEIIVYVYFVCLPSVSSLRVFLAHQSLDTCLLCLTSRELKYISAEQNELKELFGCSELI